MTKTNNTKGDARTASPTGRVWVIGGAVLVVAAVALVAMRASNPPETGPMGGLLYETDMVASGVAAVGGLEVHGAELELGQVPFNVTVVPAGPSPTPVTGRSRWENHTPASSKDAALDPSS